jgi:hypothetical protein
LLHRFTDIARIAQSLTSRFVQSMNSHTMAAKAHMAATV